MRIIEQGTLGAATIVGGMVRYEAGNSVGQDTVRYEICDTDGKCPQATLDVDITAANVAPDVTDDQEMVLLEDGSTAIDVLANDSNPNGNLDAVEVPRFDGHLV